MIFRIKKGRHRAWPFKLGLWLDKNVFTWRVMFHPSCRYDLGNTDQLDTNKLIGIGYLPHHHRDSARFGWRYSKEKDQVEIMAYCYVKGKRMIKHIADAEIGKLYRLELYVTGHSYTFYVTEESKKFFKPVGEAVLLHNHNKKLQYRLGPWFGGNRPAPHDIHIQIERV